MKTELALLATIMASLVCAVASIFFIFVAEINHSILLIVEGTPYILLATFVMFALYFVGNMFIMFVRKWHRRHDITPDIGGVFALTKDQDYVNHTPAEVQAIAAITHQMGAFGLKQTAATTERALRAITDSKRPPELAQWQDLPEEEPVQKVEHVFPHKIDVYNAPLPPEPALLVGEGVDGQISFKLHNLGSVLVGGLSGFGKSELLASMMAGLMRKSPDGREVQIAVIDTKRIDFGLLPDDAAIMFAPVAKEMNTGRALVADILTETQRRFELLEKSASRSLLAYNAKVSPSERLPYIVFFVDELADWIKDKEFNESALATGRKGRAAGVNLVLATQRPSSDVVDSSLRAVAGASIAFRVKSHHDSRTILDEKGAEELPSNVKGRCLVWNGRMQMCQAYFAGIEEERFDAFTRTLPKISEIRDGTWRDKPNGYMPQPLQPPTATTAVVAPDPFVQSLDRGRKPSPQIAQAMRQLYAGGMSKTRICFRYWNYKDGIVWGYLNDALDHQI